MKTLTILILAVMALGSCATFTRCKNKFAGTLTDSVRVQVPVRVTVPRDSVITSFVTDTTYLYKEIQQGRAKVIIERTNHTTTVQARCDTITVTKLVQVKVPGPTINWGVAKWYKKAFHIAMVLLLLSAGLIFLLFYNHKTKP